VACTGRGIMCACYIMPKLWAERQYNVQAGLTAGEDRDARIGQEGVAETRDAAIAIYTEWYDRDGRPLPLPVRWPGDLRETYKGEVLGQVVHHDVMIQRGNLAFTETDLEVRGKGASAAWQGRVF